MGLKPLWKMLKDLLCSARNGYGSVASRRSPLEVKARPLGLRRGLEYDDVNGLIEQIEGPVAR